MGKQFCLIFRSLECFVMIISNWRAPPLTWGFPCGSADKESTCNAGDLGSIPGLGRSPGEGKGYPLQHCGLENSMGCIVCGVAQSRTRLSDFQSSQSALSQLSAAHCSPHSLSAPQLSLLKVLVWSGVYKVISKMLEENEKYRLRLKCQQLSRESK